MRIKKLFEELDDDIFDEMTIADGLLMLAELAEEDQLSDYEIDIIEDMFDELDDDEDMDDENSSIDSKDSADSKDSMDSTDNLDEAQRIDQHGDTQKERKASFKKSKSSDRIKKRIYQRRYRRKANVKMKARKKAARQKTCGRNQTAQLAKKGGSSYTCRLKNRFKSKLMRRVARLYK